MKQEINSILFLELVDGDNPLFRFSSSYKKLNGVFEEKIYMSIKYKNIKLISIKKKENDNQLEYFLQGDEEIIKEIIDKLN